MLVFIWGTFLAVLGAEALVKSLCLEESKIDEISNFSEGLER